LKVLIFGANGQDGHYLAEYCRELSFEVIGVSRSGSWLQGNVASRRTVADLIRHYRPQLIFHLAALSSTRYDAMYENHATIGMGTINILDAVKKWVPGAKVFLAGSGLQFINHGTPISETDTLGHDSPYTAARNYSVYLARYFRDLGLHIYIGYLFHHESPYRKPYHVCQQIVGAARRIAAGCKDAIELGDICVLKEWTFARDIVRGMMTLVQQDRIYEATIGSGTAYPISAWLDECFKIIDKDWRKYVRLRDNFQSPFSILVSNPATINSLGWYPKTTMAELARIMMNQRNPAD